MVRRSRSMACGLFNSVKAAPRGPGQATRFSSPLGPTTNRMAYLARWYPRGLRVTTSNARCATYASGSESASRRSLPPSPKCGEAATIAAPNRLSSRREAGGSTFAEPSIANWNIFGSIALYPTCVDARLAERYELQLGYTTRSRARSATARGLRARGYHDTTVPRGFRMVRTIPRLRLWRSP